MKDVSVITYSYVMKNKRGVVLDSPIEQPVSYIETHKQTFSAVEEALRLKGKGDSTRIQLKPEDAFGAYKEDLVLELPKEKFNKRPNVDDWIQAKSPSGKVTRMRVVDFTDEKVVLDGNHPLSGIEIFMDIKILDKRPASSQELETGKISEYRSAPDLPAESRDN